MPRLDQPHEIRAILNRDRPWSAYALGDLEPELFAKCVWFFADDSLALVYLGFGITVVVALGDDRGWPAAWREACEFLGQKQDVYMSVRPAVMDHLRANHVIRVEKAMWRMLLVPPLAMDVNSTDTKRLCVSDAPAVERLYVTGEPAGEAPDFFQKEMLVSGVYYGIWDGGELAAVGGTHLVSRTESVAALGNIFTRSDCRGRGLSTAVTYAVARELVTEPLATIILNVRRDNEAARRVYHKLGFNDYCPYFEAIIIT